MADRLDDDTTKPAPDDESRDVETHRFRGGYTPDEEPMGPAGASHKARALEDEAPDVEGHRFRGI